MLTTLREALFWGAFWGITYFILTYFASMLASFYRDWDNW